jgi:hypothetical protein
MDWTDIMSIVWLIVIIILLLIFISLPLYLTARWLDEDEGFGRAVGTTILMVASLVLCLLFIPIAILNLVIAVIINLVIVKYSYDTDWGKAFAMWIVTVIVAVILLLIIAFVLGFALLSFAI